MDLAPFRDSEHVTGVNQTLRAVGGGRAVLVMLARDASEPIRASVLGACAAAGVPVRETATMKELGAACGINRPAAAAAIMDEGGTDADNQSDHPQRPGGSNPEDENPRP